MAPFYGWGSTASKVQSHYKEVVYFLPLKAESTLEPPSGFEHGTRIGNPLGLGIQCLNC